MIRLLAAAACVAFFAACATTGATTQPAAKPAPAPTPTPTPEVEVTPTPSPTPAPTPTPTPSPTPKPSPKPFVLAAVGDIMMGTTFPEEPNYLPPEGPKPFLDRVAPAFEGADILFGNLEGPLIDGGETKKCRKGQNCYAFRSPTSYAKLLKAAGFDVLSVANNHALDFGDAGRDSTIEALEAQGIRWSGPPGSVGVVEAGGQEVATVAFSTASHSNDFRDIPAAVALIKALSEKYPIVVVSFHGGTEGSRAIHMTGADEYLGKEFRGNPMQFARAVIDAGADLVIGHGPHVLRALEVYNDRLIAYSLGNFFTYGRFNLRGVSGEAVVLHAKLGPDGRFLEGRAVSVVQRKPGGPKIDSKKRGVKLLQKLTKDDIEVPGLEILDDGTLRPATGAKQ